MKKPWLAMVEWYDATTDSGWKSLRYDLTPARIVSVGWVAKEPTKKRPRWVLVGDIGHPEGNRRLAIPDDWVQSIVRLVV